MEYFLSIDQGTTSTRCILFNENGEIKLSHQVEIKQYFPDSNSVEHDGKEIIKTVEECIKAVVKNIDTNSIKSVGLTNQRETAIAWSKSTGEPFHNAIVWQDTRTQDICNELLANKKLKNHFEKTGLPVATYFSLSKILWLIRNVPSIKNGLDDDVCFGTIDSWIIYNLTGKFLTDVTNASRTLMFDIYDLDWSQGNY